MTTRGRLNARLDPEMERKVAYLRQRTGLGTSDLVRASIECYYEAVHSGRVRAHDILEAAGFIASGSAAPDLSDRYKEHLASALGRKHS
jgi:predicted DNA-binding protein